MRTPKRATILLTALAVFASPEGARAEKAYIQEACTDATNASDGFSASLSGPWVFLDPTCADGEPGLATVFPNVHPHNPGDHGQIRYEAPHGTTILSLHAYRDAQVGGANIGAVNIGRLFHAGGNADFVAGGIPPHIFTKRSYETFGIAGSWFAFRIECQPDGTNFCPSTDSYFRLRDMRIKLEDTSAPQVAGVFGEVTDPAARNQRTAVVRASDVGGGIGEIHVQVGGNPSHQVYETCTPLRANARNHYSSRVPCPLQGDFSVPVSTAGLREGRHNVQFRVFDATRDNVTTTGVFSILVDNLPPTVTPPSLSGTAREGDELTCLSAIDGQDPQVAYQWIRTRADGSGRAVIGGVSEPKLTLGPAEVGQKVLCRVTATDGGGSTARETSIGQDMFSDGRTVAGFCTDRPTGKRDPCGDFDGDGIVNRLDDDADGDGVDAANDPDDLDPTSTGIATGSSVDPGPPGPVGASGPAGTPGPGGRGGANPAAPALADGPPGVLNGANATADAVLRVGDARGRSVITVPYGRRVALTGRLTTPGGAPIAAAKLDLSFQTRLSGSPLRGAGALQTDGDGRFRITVPPGPSQTVRLLYRARFGDASAVRSVTATIKVRAGVTLRLSRPAVRNGGVLRYSGRLLGIGAGSRFVDVEVRSGRTWIDVCSVRTSRSGTFACRHRFTRTFRRTRYVFRARAVRQRGLPYETGVSKTTAVVVRP